MPTINVLFEDLEHLVGRSLPRNAEALSELLASLKGEVESIFGDELSIELKDGNRPDLWCVEGIARELKGSLGIESGLKKYMIKKASGVEVFVDSRIESIRPFIGCSVVKTVHINNESIKVLMHLQDKLDETYGRKRRRTSIGFYRFELINPPLHYKVSNPEEHRFIPLGSSKVMTLDEILRNHPKGIEYSPIIRSFPLWPILVDDQDQVLSFPPIINSNTLGKITEGDKDILVEVTGTNYQSVLNTLAIVTLSLADRGQDILSVKINYPYDSVKQDVTPKLETKKMTINPRDVNRLLGLNLKPPRIAELLKKVRYDAQVKDYEIEVTVPCYRMDIMSSVDIIEDVAISYGFNKISPIWPKIATIGAVNQLEERSDIVREIMIGLGFQEILSFSLTDKVSQGQMMGLDSPQLVEVTNPSNINLTHLRSWLLPNLMAFLSNNLHTAYPQKIFEVGDCFVLEKVSTQRKIREVHKLAAVLAHSSAGFSELKIIVEAFFTNLGAKPEIKESKHPSFIAGRVGNLFIEGICIGVAGELAPPVLEKWGLSNPVVGFEIDLTSLLKVLK